MGWSGRFRRGNKYDAVRTEYNGVTYDSKAEARQALELDFELKCKFITSWERQVTICLGKDFKTRVDFVVDGLGGLHAREVKGVETPQFKTVRRLWKKYGPFPMVILKRKGNGWTREVVNGKS